MLTAVMLAALIGTQPLQVNPPAKVDFVVGESESGKREREVAEEAQRQAQIAKKARESYDKSVLVLYADNTNNCVEFSKRETGISRPLGNGARNAIQGQEPRVGAIGSLKDYVHAVVITEVNGEHISFKESNYIKNRITSRTLMKSEFLGFIYY